MGSKGSSSNSSGNSFGFSSGTSTYTPNPQAQAAFQQSLGMANNAVSKPYEPYQGQMVAGFTPDQMSAQQGVRNLQGMAQPYFNTATNLQQQAVDYSNPNNFNEYSLNQYMNPYQKSVVDATMANLLQNEQQALQGADKRAALSGTFGGSGQFLGRAEVARQQALANAQTLAQLNQSNYQQAQNQYNQQQAQAVQTAQSAAYGLGQLGNMAQQSALTGLNALSASGAQQQALGQQQLTGAYNQWLAQKAYPFQMAAFYSDIAAGIGPQMGGTTTYSGINMGQQQSQSRQSGGGGGGLGGIMSLASMLPFADGGAVKSDDEEQGFGSLREHHASGGATADQNSSSSDDTAQLAQINERLINTIGPQNLEQQARQRWVSQAPAQTAQAAGFVFPANLMRTAAEGGLISDELVDPDYELADEIGQHKQHHLRQRWINKKLDPKSYEVSEVGFVIPENLMPREARNAGGSLIGGMDPVDYHKQFAMSEREHLAREREIAKRMRHSHRTEKADGGGLIDMITKNSLLAGSPLQGNLGDVAKIRPANNAINNLPAEARKDFHFLNPAQSKAKSITGSEVMKGVSEAQHAASEAGKGGGGGGSGGGGGGSPKMPSMKGKKASGSPTADALGENTPTDSNDNQQSNTPDTTADNSNPSQEMPPEYTAAPEDVPTAPEVNTDSLGEMASPDIAGGGFGGFDMPMLRKGGRVKRAGGGGSGGGSATGAASAPATLGSFADTPALLGSDATLGDLAMNGKLKPSDLAGFGNLKASQGKFTGDNLVGDWMSQYRANYKGGPQKTPEQQGMPSLPGQDWYKTPLNVSDLSIGSPGKSNPGGISYTPIATGMSMNGGMGMFPSFTPPTNGSDYNDTTKMFQAPPSNGKVEGYYTGLDSQQINPDTGLFNTKYIGPYYGGFYKDGGRVERGVGGKLYDLFHPMIDRIANGIASVETGGHKNPYAVIGPRSKRGDMPYGKYQIMGANIPKWGAEAGYKNLTPSQFLRDPKIQEDVARTQFAKLYGQSGNPTHVAGEWLGGPGWRTNKHTDVLGTSVPKYMQRFNVAFGNGTQPNNRLASQQPSTQPTTFTRAPEGQRFASNYGQGFRAAPTQVSGSLRNFPKLTTTEQSTQPRSFFDRLSKEFSGRAEAAEAPIGSSLNRINPADPSGPLLTPAANNNNQLPVRGLGIETFGTNPPNIDAVPLNRSVDESYLGAMPRLDRGPAPSAGDRQGWDQQKSVPTPALFDANPAFADAQGTSTLDETGKVSKQPGFIVDQNANSLFGDLGLGGDVVRPMRMPGANMQPTGFEGLQLNPFSPDEQPTAAPATNQTSPAPRSAQPEHSNLGQSNAGDWRNADPWRSDPIGGAFDSLMGDTSGSESPADKSNGFEGLDLPDFNFARGGTVRRGYAIGGEPTESNDFGDLSDNPLSALGEGISNIGNSLSNGFGNIFGDAEEPRTPRREVAALTENKPSPSSGLGAFFNNEQPSQNENRSVAADNSEQPQQGFGGLGILPTHGFLGDGTSYEMTPFRKGLLAAGLATMASHQASPLAALGEGAGHGLGVWQNAQEDYDAQQLKQQRLKADQDFARRIAYPGSTQPTTTAPDSEQSAAPEKTSAPQNAEPNYNEQIGGLRRRLDYLQTLTPATPAQRQSVRDQIADTKWRISQAQNEQKASQGTIGTTVDEFGSPIQIWKTGPKAGQRYVAPPAETPAASPNATPSTEDAPTAAPTNLSGDAYLKKLPADVQNEVRLIAEGSMELPKGVRGQALWKAVTNFEPGFDMTKYNARKAMRTGYTDQTGTKPGAQILFGNTAIGHGAELAELALDLGNYDPELLNKPINWLRENYGGDFAEKVNRYNALRHKYVDEMQKFYKGSGGGTAEERNAAAAILDPNKGPRALVSALYEDARDMESKLIPLQEKWRETMGPQAGEYKILGDNAQQQLKKLGKIYHDTTGKDAEFHGGVSIDEQRTAPPSLDQLEVGKVYEGAKGKARWTGTGFAPVE